MAPRGLRPDRPGGERERAEDRPLVDRRRSSRGRSAPRASRAGAAPSTRPSRSRRRRSARSARGSRRSAARCPGRRPRARRRRRARSRARPGRRQRPRAPEREIFEAELFGDDVLKGRPAQYREDRVVQPEKRQVARRVGETLAPTPPTTSGIASGRKSSGRISSRVAAGGGHRREQRADGADADVREQHAGTAPASSGEKKSANAGSATSSIAARKTKHRGGLAEPDRAAVAGREHEPVERAVLALGRPGAREAEQRREDERHPEQPVRRDLVGARRAARSGRRRASRGRRAASPAACRAPAARAAGPCARARRRRRGTLMRAPAVRSRAARPGAGSWVVSRTVAAPASCRELAVEQLGALGVERGERLVEDEQLGVVQQRAAEREPLRHAARVRGDALGARRPRARSARAASRSARAARGTR